MLNDAEYLASRKPVFLSQLEFLNYIYILYVFCNYLFKLFFICSRAFDTTSTCEVRESPYTLVTPTTPT